MEGAIDLHHRDQLDGRTELAVLYAQLDGRTEPAVLYAVGAPGMSETKTKQVRGASKANTLQC